jgi:hypothetical protein
MSTFLTHASPITLASFIRDVEALGKGATSDAIRLAKEADRILRCNVGDAEADAMIQAAN